MISGSCVYKSRSGIVSIDELNDPPVLTWEPVESEGNPLSLRVSLRLICGLQANAPTSDKMKIRIQYKVDANADPKPINFVFKSRVTMNKIKDSLQVFVSRQKLAMRAQELQEEKEKQNKLKGKSTFQNTNDRGTSIDDILDFKKLIKDFDLQKEFLSKNPMIFKTFQETVIENKLTPVEFWSARIHLLRTFALQSAQKRGPYNVLSTIKPVEDDDRQSNISLTREKIFLMFEQYPIIKRAYDENVPRMSEGEFWSRFFSSLLFRKLKGEKIKRNDTGDVILDKYLKMDLNQSLNDTIPNVISNTNVSENSINNQDNNIHINRFINLDANEQDVSQKLGNRPDFTMRTDKNDEIVPILKGMNKLSKKLVDLSHDEFSNPSKRRFLDSQEELNSILEKETEELILSDLEDSFKTEYIELNIQNKNTRGLQKKKSKLNNILVNFSKEDELRILNYEKTLFNKPLDFKSVFSNKECIDQISSKVNMTAKINSKQSKQSWQASKLSTSNTLNATNLLNNTSDQIEDKIFGTVALEALRRTHITSVEFLRHFWIVFSSGDPSQSKSLQKLYTSIKKCDDRVTSVIESLPDKEKKDRALIYLKPLKDSLNRAILEFARVVRESNNQSRAATPINK
ncbi:TFIIH/NER complex subunit TFB1 [Ascoidea rubescens DSM 1968]|uniref:BSD-domain-containing protein n=1 Tax=Ascoidea rubescens DSM 1968 TaxID=1344418 RepID=A0A1D2VFH6_9ASCO|nr:BSD-domain-containing protein [Ascoidea rubescens DSM 1968]ODV60424.1 BSD-domain-containing protein [Ascoidea rubescens DSM 1968]